MAINKIILPGTNLAVSRIGCGLLRLGRKWGIDTPGEKVTVSEAEAYDFLEGAVKLGINFFDTAPAYGVSERLLSGFLKENPAIARDLIIATKCGEHQKEDGSTYYDYSADAIERSIENSLALLGHIHLLQIHSVNSNVLEDNEALQVLEKHKNGSDVDLIGVTASWPPEIVRESINTGIFSTIQVAYNPLMNEMEQVMAFAKNKNITVLVNQPLIRGILSSKSKYADGQMLEGWVGEKLLMAGELQKKIGEKSLAKHSFEFIFNNPNVSVVFTGTRSLDHLRQNIGYLNNL